MDTSAFSGMHPILEELNRIDPSIDRQLLEDGVGITGHKSAEGWLLDYATHAKDTSYIKRVAAVLISFTSNYHIFHPWPPDIIALGALMMSRHLCGAGRGPPMKQDEEALEVMTTIDRTLRNEHSLMPEEVYEVNPRSSHWEMLYRLDEFYEDWRDELEPVPRTLEIYRSGPTSADYRSGKARRPAVTLMHFPDRI
ncbi:hypothetical protein OE88DRAFT_1736175 [Heliocybe sulcata]|uniref:Cyclin N-terminal domain-containing protein n=1 Tax=Heliocybe sulcata TaxID=5364 RepID=A0A5C3N053_9AGAM|nr:hypothetical protein OE88DRAFT_1736175 [Heliocybe sulcata]